MKILLYGHDGSHNRGCEAIVRTTVDMLNNEFSKNLEITVASNNPERDANLKLKSNVKFIEGCKKRITRGNRIVSAAANRILKSTILYELQYLKTIRESKNNDICISIGGDNYSEYRADLLNAVDEKIRSYHPQMVLWGCSLDPEKLALTKKKLNNIRAFSLITARESITYNGLIDNKIDKNVHLHTDPAFTMEAAPVVLPELWQEDNMIGLNISPLINNFESRKDSVFHESILLIRHILSNTSYNIVLIPHVVFKSDDSVPLTLLYKEFMGTGRVLLIGSGYNAPQTKYLISKCRMLVCARTHASIAAYSTCVPTLVLGYSVKARGIARDIFGDEKGLVLPVQELDREKQLIGAFEGLREREAELRKYLQGCMPKYIESAWQAVKHIRKLIDR